MQALPSSCYRLQLRNGVDFATAEALLPYLAGLGIGIILDIVPNHMAFSLENSWLRDVLRKGHASRWYRHFDIRPDGPLLLPILDAPFQELLAQKAFRLDTESDGPVLVYEGRGVPLNPQTLSVARGDQDIGSLHEQQF